MLEVIKKNGFAVAGFVLSLIGIVSSWLVQILEFLPVMMLFYNPGREVAPLLPVFGYSAVSILGVIFSSVGIARARKVLDGAKLSIAGLILGIIGLIGTVFMILSYGMISIYIESVIL